MSNLEQQRMLHVCVLVALILPFALRVTLRPLVCFPSVCVQPLLCAPASICLHVLAGHEC